MIQSMTGFAERKFDSQKFSARISIKTLNHRFFDWHYRGPQIGIVESRLRAISQRKIHRGRVEVLVELIFLDASEWDFWLNENLLGKMISSLEKMSSKLKKNISVSLENIFAIPHAVEIRNKGLTAEDISFLENIFEMTLNEVIKARIREGRQLRQEISSYVQDIKRITKHVEKLARAQPLAIRQKLEQRLKELSHETLLSEEKIAEEAAYLAQRYNLTEEVTRLKCHLNYMEELLSSKIKDSVGKKLDFIAQELNREANTINSKAQDIEMIKEILAIKNKVESIRQQVQNIE